VTGLSQERWLRRRFLRQQLDEVAYPTGIAPFVVVPGRDFHQPFVHDVRQGRIDGRGMIVAFLIDGYNRIFRVFEDALERSFRRLLEGGIDRRHVTILFRLHREVDQGDVGSRHADGQPVEPPLQLRDDEVQGLGGAGAGRNHRHTGRAGTAEILMRKVQELLVVGIGMDRRHDTVLDPEIFQQHFGDRRQAVRRARRVRDDVMGFGVELVFVHPED